MSATATSDLRPLVARVTRRLLGAARAERVIRPLFRSGERECSVCGAQCDRFVPLAPLLARTATEKGFPFGPDDMETLNAREYSCPVCLESDRSRLYALYLKRALAPASAEAAPKTFVDFAPSPALSRFLRALPGIRYRSADLYMLDVDDRADLMDLRCYPDGSVDGFLCSHVLEHVTDHHQARPSCTESFGRAAGESSWCRSHCRSRTRTRFQASSRTMTGGGTTARVITPACSRKRISWPISNTPVSSCANSAAMRSPTASGSARGSRPGSVLYVVER